MKKLFIAAIASFVFANANAQMKLGNNPTTTNSNALLEMETTNKGMLLPRVALTSTTSFAPLTAHVAGMAVYNTATAGDVTPGYYFDNGTAWVRIADANASVATLYNADGVLTGPRRVSLAGNNLVFTGTSNIGIGTALPTAKLEVAGTTKTDALQVVTGAAAGKVLTSDAAGLATWATPAVSSNLYTANGTLAGNRIVTQGANTLAFTGTAVNAFSVDGTTLSVDAANARVGIGTAAPAGLLDVRSNTASGLARSAFKNDGATSRQDVQIGAVGAGDIYVGVDATGTFLGTGVKAYLDNRTTGRLALGSGGTEHLTLLANGNVGVGTITPTTKLEVVGTTKTDALQVVTGAAAGKVLTSDAAGLATWATPAVSSNLYSADGTLAGNRIVAQGANTLAFTGTAVNAFSVDGSTFSVDATNGRVGIGTAAPVTQFTNTTLNILSSDGTGMASKTLGWVQSGGGLIGAFFNGGTAVNAGGLAVKIAGTAASNKLLDLSVGATQNVAGTSVMAVLGNGNVGIGTNAPTTDLEVIGTTKTNVLQVVTGAGAGKVLTSNATGVASWVAPAVSVVTSAKYFGAANTTAVAVGKLEFRYSTTAAGGLLQWRSTTGASITGLSLFITQNWSPNGYGANASSSQTATTTFASVGDGLAADELNTVYVYDTVNSTSYRVTLNLVNGGSLFESLLVETF